MKLFIASSLCWAYHPNEVITIAKEKSLDGVELWAEHFFYHQAEPEEVRFHAEMENIELTVHASSFDLNICSLNKGIQVQSFVELKKSINLAHALGALHMTFHPGKLTIENYLVDEHREILIMNTRKLLDYARQKDVVLSIKLMAPNSTEILSDPQAMKQFLDEVGKGLYITLNTAHTPLEKSNISYFKELQQVNSIHLSDVRKDQTHVPLGQGQVDVREVLRFFENTNLPIVLDGMDVGNSLLYLKEHLAYLKKYYMSSVPYLKVMERFAP